MRAGWAEKTSADNAAATATRALEAGKAHVIFAVTASFSAVVSGGKLLQLKLGTTVVWEGIVGATAVPSHIVFPAGIAGAEGATVSALLAASGTGGVTGYLTLHGATVP